MAPHTRGRKNVCLTINSLAKGGAEKQCLLLAKALRSHHNVYLVVLNPTTQDPYYRKVVDEEKIQVAFLSRNPIMRMVKLIQFLKRKKIEVVFSFLPVDTIMAAICGWLARVPYRFGGIRNSYLPRGKHMILRAVNNHLLHYTIANNYAAYESALAFGFKEKVMVIHNGIEIRPPISRQGRSANETTIISVGRLVKQKDYETALKSVARLKEMLPMGHKLRYRIIGYGEERHVISQHIIEYGLEDEVELLERSEGIYELLETSDIYLCTSIFEGISNAIQEAMNTALPIVATNVGDNVYLVVHEKNGFITDVHDDGKIADYLFHLASSEEMRVQMGARGHELLTQNFSYQRFKERYLELLGNLDTIHIKNGKPGFNGER